MTTVTAPHDDCFLPFEIFTSGMLTGMNNNTFEQVLTLERGYFGL